MHDIAEFLKRHPPFDALEPDELESVSAAAEIEFHAARTPILDSAQATSSYAWVVRRGSVELLVDGRLLDVLGEGEMFGFASLLAEEPLGFVARAGEDSLLYRFPAETIRPVLERPASVRFIARAIDKGVRLLAGREDAPTHDTAGRQVHELIRAQPLLLPPGTSVQDAARGMAEAGVTCVVVDLGDGLGIVTDRDIRTRVVAAGAGPDTPLREVMSAPARTISADRTGSEALLVMLDHGVRHLPVLDARRRLLGVLDDVDLMASERRAPFRLRAAIARAGTFAEVAEAAAELADSVIALHDAGLPAATVSGAITSVHDSVTRRLIDITLDEHGPAPVPFTWLAMGSFGRFEPFPSSDVDCALAWEGPDDEEIRAAMVALAERVLAGLAASGFEPDEKGAVATSSLFARPVEGWQAAARGWIEDPDQHRGLMLLSVVVESDAVWGSTAAAERIAAAFATTPGREHMLIRLATAALAERPPTGFLRQFVLHGGGERRGALDIKRRGLQPIESLARWAGLSAGVSAASTRARLDAAERAGRLGASDAALLRDSYELMAALRMEHQVERLRSGGVPDDLIDPKSLAPLTRTSLKEAFRQVAKVQRGIRLELGLAPR
jgi:CBS domain-containing protein